MITEAPDVPTIDGYRWVREVVPDESDFDLQGHLNNASTVQLFGRMRVRYLQHCVGEHWGLHRDGAGHLLVVKEMHVLYESEGLPGERFAGAARAVQRSGRAIILEQRLVELTTARPVARTWLVQLLISDGRAQPWPARYLEGIEAFEGRALVDASGVPRAEFAPPAP